MNCCSDSVVLGAIFFRCFERHGLWFIFVLLFMIASGDEDFKLRYLSECVCMKQLIKLKSHHQTRLEIVLFKLLIFYRKIGVSLNYFNMEKIRRLLILEAFEMLIWLWKWNRFSCWIFSFHSLNFGEILFVFFW